MITEQDILNLLNTGEGRRLIEQMMEGGEPFVPQSRADRARDVLSYPLISEANGATEGFVDDPIYDRRGGSFPGDASLINTSSPAEVSVIQNTDQSPPTLVPRGRNKRLPTLDERRAGGDPYPEGPWRKMFPNAEIEYSYPGDDDYGQRNGMIKQLLKNQDQEWFR